MAVSIGKQSWSISTQWHDYIVHRKDRADNYGGVFVACICSSDFVCHELPLDTTAEVVACRIVFNGQHPLIICSLYRPPDRSVSYLQELFWIFDHIICDNPDDIIWLAGDINLPNIEWASSSIANSGYPIPLAMWGVFGSDQYALPHSRISNTLDIFKTNRPSLIKQYYPKPGIGDHEIVYVESYIGTPIQQGHKRKLYNWSKADFETLNLDFIRFSEKFLSDYSADTPIIVEREFKQACKECLQQLPVLALGNHGLQTT